MNEVNRRLHEKQSDRRRFLGGWLAAGAVSLLPGALPTRAKEPPPARHSFRLKYAPHFGMFKEHAGNDLIDQLKFAAAQGFTAWEDNEMVGRPVRVQEQIATQMQRLGMSMGIILMNRVTGFREGGALTTGKLEDRDAFLEEVRQSIDVARRVNAKWMTSFVGNTAARLPPGYQLANVIDCLRRACELLEPHGLTMVFEPLNVYEDHPGFFIHRNDELYALMKAVRSPSCKMLYDLYHSQISEGRLIYNFDRCYDEIGYVQTGDTPGRNEPGTGEIDYRNVFKHIYDKGYTGILGMEHGNSRPGRKGERAVIDAYVAADSF